MGGRTFAIGDIHGDLHHLERLLGRLPALDTSDTLVFMGDYIDRGAASAQVVELVRALPGRTKAKVVTLRGNHEDAWMRVIDDGWPEFLLPPGNGCLPCYQSFAGTLHPDDPVNEDAYPDEAQMAAMLRGEFFPPEVVAWMRELPYFYEDEHAIYVHAGVPEIDGKYLHPRDVEDKHILLWMRTKSFFTDYRGKLIVVGHTATAHLPQEYSAYTPEDPLDMWAGPAVAAIDTGCGKGGFLTALELPARGVYESRL